MVNFMLNWNEHVNRFGLEYDSALWCDTENLANITSAKYYDL